MKFFVDNRILWSRIFVVFIIIFLLISTHSWAKNSLIYLLMKWVGFIFVVTATLGRLWCSIYISGYKEDVVINQGPYSMVRNPLYLFSFIGAMGLGLASANIIVILIIFVLFTFFYPSVVSSEEKILLERHGNVFSDYINSTPKWFPKFSNFKRPKKYLVQIKQFESSIISSMWFLWFFLIFHIIELLHETNVLPTIIRIP